MFDMLFDTENNVANHNMWGIIHDGPGQFLTQLL